jgi:hypothetical protein
MTTVIDRRALAGALQMMRRGQTSVGAGDDVSRAALSRWHRADRKRVRELNQGARRVLAALLAGSVPPGRAVSGQVAAGLPLSKLVELCSEFVVVDRPAAAAMAKAESSVWVRGHSGRAVVRARLARMQREAEFSGAGAGGDGADEEGEAGGVGYGAAEEHVELSRAEAGTVALEADAGAAASLVLLFARSLRACGPGTGSREAEAAGAVAGSVAAEAVVSIARSKAGAAAAAMVVGSGGDFNAWLRATADEVVRRQQEAEAEASAAAREAARTAARGQLLLSVPALESEVQAAATAAGPRGAAEAGVDTALAALRRAGLEAAAVEEDELAAVPEEDKEEVSDVWEADDAAAGTSAVDDQAAAATAASSGDDQAAAATAASSSDDGAVLVPAAAAAEAAVVAAGTKGRSPRTRQDPAESSADRLADTGGLAPSRRSVRAASALRILGPALQGLRAQAGGGSGAGRLARRLLASLGEVASEAALLAEAEGEGTLHETSARLRAIRRRARRTATSSGGGDSGGGASAGVDEGGDDSAAVATAQRNAEAVQSWHRRKAIEARRAARAVVRAAKSKARAESKRRKKAEAAFAAWSEAAERGEYLSRRAAEAQQEAKTATDEHEGEGAVAAANAGADGCEAVTRPDRPGARPGSKGGRSRKRKAVAAVPLPRLPPRQSSAELLLMGRGGSAAANDDEAALAKLEGRPMWVDVAADLREAQDEEETAKAAAAAAAAAAGGSVSGDGVESAQPRPTARARSARPAGAKARPGRQQRSSGGKAPHKPGARAARPAAGSASAKDPSARVHAKRDKLTSAAVSAAAGGKSSRRR